MKKRIMSLLLVCCMVFTLMPTAALAAEDAIPPTSGYCGGDTTAEPYEYLWQGVSEEHATQTAYKNIAWELVPNGSNDEGTTYKLVLTGSGPMFDFTQIWTTGVGAETDEPWWDVHLQITEVDIADGITTISNLGFYALRLESVEIPDSVTSIGVSAFGDNTHLKSVVIGAGVETIKQGGFNRDYALESLTFKDGADLTIGVDGFYGANVETFTFPSRVRSVAYRAFGNWTSLKSVVFEKNTDLAIASAAFDGCNALTDVDMSAIDCDGSKMGSVFTRCATVENIKLPTSDKFTKLPAQLFSGCTALKTVVIPANITGWGVQVFADTSVHSLVFETENMADADNCGVNFVQSDKAEKVIVYTQKATDTAWNKAGPSNSGLYRTNKQTNAVTNGGTFPVDTVFEEGVLATPIKDGYKFDGWYTDAAFSAAKKLTDNIAPANNTTCYAKWVECDHTDISYTAKGNVITEACGCGHIFNTVTLNAPSDLTYDGLNKACTITKSDAWQDTSDLTVEYYDAGENKLDEAPVNAGNYTAKVTVQGVTASVDIKIDKAEPSIQISAVPAALTGAGTVKLTVTTTGVPEGGAITVACEDLTVTVSTAPDADGSYSVALPNETKTYIFKANYAGDDNHESAEDTCSVSVTRRSSGGSSSSGSSYAVSAPSTKNGDVTVSPKTAKKGDTVTITVTPDKDYELDTITVKDASGNTLKLTDKGNGQYTFTMPGSKVTVSAEFAEAQADAAFADVPSDSYYTDAVAWAVKKGITNGKGNGLFGSNDPCTRGQIVTFLWRAAGSPEPKSAVSLTDVPADAYYAKAVAWAIENGITLGTTDTTFGPDAACTRAQSVTFLYRALGKLATSKAAFSDIPAGSYYADAVAWAVENGVTNGTSAATFSPNNGCTRAQIVMFLYRAYQGK